MIHNINTLVQELLIISLTRNSDIQVIPNYHSEVPSKENNIK